MSKLQIVCAWCGDVLGEKEADGVEGTTDGICDHCLKLHFPHLYEKTLAALEVDNVEDIYKGEDDA